MKKTHSKESDDESHDLDNVGRDFTKNDEPNTEDETSAETDGESEGLSDIDDGEVDGYLVKNEDEKKYRRIIWEKLNREYVEEQAAKKAAAAAAKRAFKANFENCSGDLLAARELATSATAAVAKSRKELRQKRALEAKSSGPALSAAEAACQMVTKKRLNSKVNLEKLRDLFESDTEDAGNTKKVKFALDSDHEDKSPSKVEDKKDDELGYGDDEFEDGDMGGEYGNNYYPENDDSYFPEDGDYNYDDDDDQY